MVSTKSTKNKYSSNLSRFTNKKMYRYTHQTKKITNGNLRHNDD